MQLYELEYSYSRSAMTNPPAYEHKTIELRREEGGSAALQYVKRGTWGEREAALRLTSAQYAALCALFESGQIRAQAAQAAAPENHMQVGGATVESFRFRDEQGSAQTDSVTPQMREAVRYLESLLPPAEEIPPGAAQAPVGAFVSPPPLTPLPEGQWYCPQCGTANGGNFCTECGAKKPL